MGDVYSSKHCGLFEILEYTSSTQIKVQFKLTGYITTTQAVCVRTGQIKDKLYPTVYKIGYIGEGIYTRSAHRHIYDTWTDMLRRCYCPIHLKNRPTYIGCSICSDWHNFQNFAKWYVHNYIEGYHLDKDIKVKGNKIYSPDTCMFVSPLDNTLEARISSFKFTSPIGDIIEGTNIADFCRNHGLNPSHMYAIIKGKRKSHKGWTL